MNTSTSTVHKAAAARHCLSTFGHSVFGHSVFGHSVFGHSVFGHSVFGLSTFSTGESLVRYRTLGQLRALSSMSVEEAQPTACFRFDE